MKSKPYSRFGLVLLSLTLLALVRPASATTYYFSTTSGSDSYSGTSTSSPFKTIAKLNALMATLAPGDSVLFKCGDTWDPASGNGGTINVTATGTAGSPITFGSYSIGGVTAKPVITGFTTISGWTNEGGGIYSKVISSTEQTNMVTIDGVQYAMGRYPDAGAANGGYLTYETFASNLSITDEQLTGATDWTGAEVAIRKNDWRLDRCTVTSQVTNGDGSTTLNYTSKGSSESATANFGYFFQNDLRTVTSYGEWYHDTGSGKFYMYFGSVSPTTKTTNVATLTNLFNVVGDDYDYITVDGIAFTGAIETAVNFQNNQVDCVIRNCDISFAGLNGINFVNNCDDSLIDGNTISYCNSYGVYTQSLDATITNNTITNIGTLPGQGLTALGTAYTAIFVKPGGATIANNTIRNIGYNGIAMGATGAATIQDNLIDTVCTMLDDGGGIYMDGADSAEVRWIDHNIILNPVGNSLGTANSTPMSVGIYLDESASNVTLSANTIAGSGFAAIKLHKANNNTLVNNTTFDCLFGVDFEDNVSGVDYTGNQMTGNIFYAKTASESCLKFFSVNDDIPLFGTADNNYYARPLADDTVFQLQEPSLGLVHYTLAQWRSLTSQDADSHVSPMTTSNVNDIAFYYNPTASPATLTFPGLREMDATGTVYDNAITLPAFGSAVLIADGMAPIPNPSFTSDLSGWTYWNNSDAAGSAARTTSTANSAPGSCAVSVTTHGTSTGDIQLATQELSLINGDIYRLTFAAKGSTAFSGMGLPSVVKETTPYTSYVASSTSFPGSITTSWTPYTIDYTANITATDGRLIFNLGNSVPNGQTCYLDDVEFTDITNVQRLANPSFSTDLSGWTYWNNTDAAGSASRDTTAPNTAPACCAVAVTTQGTSHSDIQLYTKDLSVTSGRVYRLAFSAKGSAAITGMVAPSIVKETTPYTNYVSASTAFAGNISTSWAPYTIDYTAGTSANDAELIFSLGATIPNGQTCYLDDITFTDITNANRIANPSFETDLSGWAYWNNSDAAGSATRDTSHYNSGPAACAVSVVTKGTSTGDIQLSTQELSLTSGDIYRLSFSAKGSAAISGMGTPSLVKETSPYTNYVASNTAFAGAISTSWAKYTIDYIANTSASDGRLIMNLGNSIPNGQTLYLDDITLTDITTMQRIGNPSFTQDLSGWSYWNNSDASGSMARDTSTYNSGPASCAIAVTTKGTSTGDIQLSTQELSITSGKTYRLTFSAKASTAFTGMGAPTIVKETTPYTNYVTSHTTFSGSVTTGWTQYVIDYTVNTTANDARLIINLGDSIPEGATCNLDDITLTQL